VVDLTASCRGSSPKLFFHNRCCGATAVAFMFLAGVLTLPFQVLMFVTAWMYGLELSSQSFDFLRLHRSLVLLYISTSSRSIGESSQADADADAGVVKHHAEIKGDGR